MLVMSYTLRMRRWLVFFLVFLLPLQVSWAVAANYCGHEQEKTSHHFGHHQDEHHASLDTGMDEQQSGSESGLGHHHDHLSGFVALLLGRPDISIQISTSPQPRGTEPSLATLPPTQPERPNWSARA